MNNTQNGRKLAKAVALDVLPKRESPGVAIQPIQPARPNETIGDGRSGSVAPRPVGNSGGRLTEINDMAEIFDPYHMWLGIPPREQPPNHYRLLGIDLFECTPDVIANAADRQMSHLRVHQIGAHSALSQKLLNEAATARICLLNPNKKTAYDEALQRAFVKLKAVESSNGPGSDFMDLAAIGVVEDEPVAMAWLTQSYAKPQKQTKPHVRDWEFLVSLVAVCGLLAVAAITGIKVLRRPSQELPQPPVVSALMLNWPGNEWQEVTVSVDGQRMKISGPDPLTWPCQPGMRRVHAEREGFLPFDQVVDVREGASREVVLIWTLQPRLIVQCPGDARQHTTTKIDDRDVGLMEGTRYTADQLEIPLETGSHRLWMSRSGFEVFECQFTITVGKRTTISPDWRMKPSNPPSGSGGFRWPQLGSTSPPKTEAPKTESFKTEPPKSKGAQPHTKAPIPNVAAEKEALAEVRSLYEEKHKAAKDSPTKLVDLARELLQQANQPGNSLAAHYVLLRLARDLSAQAGDIELASQAIDEMAGTFEIDDILGMKIKLIDKAFKTPKTTQKRNQTIAQAIDRLLDELVAQDQYDEAEQLAKDALDWARKARNSPGLAKAMTGRRKAIVDVAKAFAEIQEAMNTLAVAPTDPDASLKVGKFHCLVKNDWEAGLVFLAVSSDDAWRKAAKAEMEVPTSADEQVALGDGWWKLGEAARLAQQDALWRHAGAWYEQARERLPNGLAKQKVQMRLEKVAQIDQAGPATPAAAASARLLKRSCWEDVLANVDLPQDAVDGDWARNANVLIGRAPNFGRILLPVSIEGSYEFQVAFTTGTSTDVILIQCPVEMGGFVLYLDGHNDSLSLKRANPLQPDNAVSTDAIGRVSVGAGRTYLIQVAVALQKNKQASIGVTVNGQPYPSGVFDLSALQFPCDLRLPRARCPAVGVYNSAVAFGSAGIRITSGRATWARSAPRRNMIPSKRPAGAPDASPLHDSRQSRGDPSHYPYQAQIGNNAAQHRIASY